MTKQVRSKGKVVMIQLTEEQVASLRLGEGQPPYQSRRPVITEPEQAYAFLKHIGVLPREHFIVLTLNTRNRVIGRHTISTGTLDATLVHPRDVFQVAILDNAAKIIIAHNHPSNDTEPSDDDILITKRLHTAGKILGIALMDHLIIGRDHWQRVEPGLTPL
jgi:DNA repair protein RadC